MAKKVKVEQPVLEGYEHLVKPKVFEVYVQEMPKAKNMSDIEVQNKALDMIESVLNGKSIEECKSESEEAKDFFEGLTEVRIEDLPFYVDDVKYEPAKDERLESAKDERQEPVKDERQEPVKDERQEPAKVERYKSDETEADRYYSEIEEKYSLPWWAR